MTNPIPQAAIDAAAEALRQKFSGHPSEEPADYEDEALAALEAALPIIRKQVELETRNQIVTGIRRLHIRDIRTENRDEFFRDAGYDAAIHHAALIAEGKTK